MRRNKKNNFISIIAIMLCLITISGCGGSKMYTSSLKDGYIEVMAVDGIDFNVVQSIARNATAITNISEDMDFEVNQTYLFKDGQDSYFLFNMGAIVCAVEKGTNFAFSSASNKVDALKSDDVLGIWFEPADGRKKLTYDEDTSNGAYKIICSVTAQVALTPDIYGDFSGKLAVIEKDNSEWALFVGTIGDSYEDLDSDEKTTIEYMAATMNINQLTETENAPAISIGGELAMEEETTEEISHSYSTDDESEIITEEDIQETTTEEEILIVESGTTETETIEEIESTETAVEQETTTESEVEETEIDIESTTEEPETEELILVKEQEDQESFSESQNLSTGGIKTTIKLDNQKKKNWNDTTVYTSDIYSLLPINKYGKATVYTGTGYEDITVRLEEIYTGKEAENIIRNAYSNGIIKGNYFSSAETNTFHVARYTYDYGNVTKEAYLDVKMKGMDGEELKYKGIRYTSRTYNIPISDTEGYVFYEIPNGCTEYVLEFGGEKVENETVSIVSAYYQIRP